MNESKLTVIAIYIKSIVVFISLVDKIIKDIEKIKEKMKKENKTKNKAINEDDEETTNKVLVKSSCQRWPLPLRESLMICH
mgnify:CR=1 FL=1